MGTTREIVGFIQSRLGILDFILELYDPISEPDRNVRIEFGDTSE